MRPDTRAEARRGIENTRARRSEARVKSQGKKGWMPSSPVPSTYTIQVKIDPFLPCSQSGPSLLSKVRKEVHVSPCQGGRPLDASATEQRPDPEQCRRSGPPTASYLGSRTASFGRGESNTIVRSVRLGGVAASGLVALMMGTDGEIRETAGNDAR